MFLFTFPHPSSKGQFTLWPSGEWTRESSNLIGGEQKFVCLAFTLKANGLQNAYMTALFVSFGAKSLYGGRILIHNIYGNQTLLEWTNFSF
jgi:hypothetical protein